jgi:hypothetical protein
MRNGEFPLAADSRRKKIALEDNGLIDDSTQLTALEARLSVLPAAPVSGKSTKLDAHLAAATSDWEALEKLRKLAFSEQVPEPNGQMLLPIASGEGGGEGELESDQE